MLSRSPRFTAVAAMGVAALSVLAAAVPTGSDVALAPHGDGVRAQGGEVLALTPTSAIVVTEGADGIISTADDVALLLGDVDTTPTRSPIATPQFQTYTGDGYTRPARLSATSAVVPSLGSDGVAYTADDSVHIVSLLGSVNDVDQVALGPMSGFYTADPQRISADLVAVGTLGADAAFDSADDELVLISDPGGANTVTRLPAPHSTFTCPSTALSPTSAVQISSGPDSDTGSADDVVYLFTDLGGINTRTDISVPRLIDGLGATPTRVSSTAALVLGRGPDAAGRTADDEVILLSDLGGTNTVTPVTVGWLRGTFGQRPLVLTDKVAVVILIGADGTATSADDELVVISDLGGTNAVTRLVLGSLNPGRVGGRPVRLSPTSCALPSAGTDGTWDTADDEIIVVRDVGGTNTIVRVAVPGLGSFHTSIATPVSATSLILSSGGADGDLGAGTDAVTLITSLDTTPIVETIASIGRHRTFTRAHVPKFLGHGRAGYVDSGPDNSLGGGGDDSFRVIDGLPRDRELTAEKIDIKFKANKPDKPAKFKVVATLLLDTPALFASGDVTVSIGNAAQTIGADDIAVHKKGFFIYKDRKRENGFIQQLKYDPVKNKLTIRGKGVGTDAETTAAEHVPLAIEVEEIYVSDAVAGTAKKSGLKYRAPK